MAEKKKKITITMKMDPALWEQIGKVAYEMGFTKSGFVEMTMKNMIKSEKTPLPQLMEEMFTEIVEKTKAKKK